MHCLPRELLAAGLLGALALAGCGAVVRDGQYYVSPDGDDSNPGTLERPWKSLRHATHALAPGDTLYLRGGRYFENDIRIRVAGSEADPITIRNYADERPVVDGGLSEFRTVPNRDWEVFNAATGVWRSVARFPGAGRVHGTMLAPSGSFRLVPYEDYGPLGATTEDYNETWPYFYIGPGVFWNEDDQRIYVRLEPGEVQERMGLAVPADPDPSRTPLVLFTKKRILELEPNAAHIRLEGIDLLHGDSAIHIASGAHHITVTDCTVLGGRYHILVRESAHDLVFDGIRVQDTFPLWVARSDVKRPENGRPGHQLQGAAISLSGAVDRIEIASCTFAGLFDGIDATGKPTNLRIHHNAFESIRDDALQLGSAGYDVEFAHNTIRDANMGVSWNGSGAPPPEKAGTKYIHHNVIDTSTPQLYCRSDPQGLLPDRWKGPKGDGMATGRAFATHSTEEITGPDPWKIYHNTIKTAADVYGHGAGHCYPLPLFDPARPHEVLNNIFIQVDDHPIARGARVDDGSQVHDGNLYHRAAEGARTPLFLLLAKGDESASFASLPDFKASSLWRATREHYAPGWEASGVEGDPRLDEDYRPDPSSPAARGAVDLSSRGWPGIRSEPFRGARPPR